MTDTKIDDYLTALRGELSDLPPGEVDDVLEDIAPQLHDAGPGGLAALGSPAAYAAELRAAAGYDRRAGSAVVPRLTLLMLVVGTITAGYAGVLTTNLVSNDARYSMPVIGLALLVAAWPLRRYGPSVRDVAALPEVRALRGLWFDGDHPVARYLASLLPGWFALQGVLAGFAGYLVAARELGWASGTPMVFGVALGLVLVAAGQRSLHDHRWLWLALPASAFAIGFVRFLAVQLIFRIDQVNLSVGW